MGFKKVDCVKELDDICKEDKEIAKYVEEFNDEYEQNKIKLIKANVGDKIRLTENLCYGGAYGLIEVEAGTEMTVIERNSSDDGVVTDKTFYKTSSIGSKLIHVEVFDYGYIIIS